MMPKLDGYGVCQELRKESDVPIIMLTAGDVADRITGLELVLMTTSLNPFPEGARSPIRLCCDGWTALLAFPVLASM